MPPRPRDTPFRLARYEHWHFGHATRAMLKLALSWWLPHLRYYFPQNASTPYPRQPLKLTAAFDIGSGMLLRFTYLYASTILAHISPHYITRQQVARLIGYFFLIIFRDMNTTYDWYVFRLMIIRQLWMPPWYLPPPLVGASISPPLAKISAPLLFWFLHIFDWYWYL